VVDTFEFEKWASVREAAAWMKASQSSQDFGECAKDESMMIGWNNITDQTGGDGSDKTTAMMVMTEGMKKWHEQETHRMGWW